MEIIMFCILLVILALNFGFACLLTWAVCFITSLFGITLVFSWKLVLAIWILSTLFTSKNVIKIRKE